MMTEQAIVTACGEGRIEVSLQRASACGQCELSGGCGTGALGRLLGNRSRPLVIETDRNLQPGDELELCLSEGALVKASLIVYGLPLVCMVFGGLVAALFGLADYWTASISIAGFVVGFGLARRSGRKLESDHLTPYIVGIRVNPGRPFGS